MPVAPPSAASEQENPFAGYAELYCTSADPIACSDCTAEVWFALMIAFIAEGIASVIRISMMDITIRSSIRVKPSSWCCLWVFMVAISGGVSLHYKL